MMAERGLSVDHSTVHLWVVHFAPKLPERFNQLKRSATSKWHVDETYIKVAASGCSFTAPSTVPVTRLSSSSARTATCSQQSVSSEKPLSAMADRIVIDGSQTNREAIIFCDSESRLRDRSRRPIKPVRIRQSQFLNNRIKQDHRRVKRHVRSMLGSSQR